MLGPITIKTLGETYERFREQSYVDSERMGIFGVSRGGMAASLLAVRLPDLRAAVLVMGIYDFQKMYDGTEKEVIRNAMMRETGMTPQAVLQRSSILQMQSLRCPLLILHGEKDQNVPVNQARLLEQELLTGR